MNLQFEKEKMPIKERDNFIISQLTDMEKKGAFW